MTQSTRHDLSKFAVIAVCFNPVRYQTRYDLYRQFEEHMSQSGVFLFTVECLFESAPVFGLPKQVYEVTQAGNPRHLQVIAPSIIWMKENLINIAVQHLPKHVEYIAWIDSDIEFERLDWAHSAIDELQRYPIVQLFEMAQFLGPNGKDEVLRQDYSFAYSIHHQKPIDPRRYQEWYPHPGYAWAMRRDAFDKIHGLCEFSILGSGDLHFAYALLNRIDETFPKNLNEDYRNAAITWGTRVAKLAQNGKDVGYLPVHVYHHWHGSRDNRGYVQRWAILERYQFAPSRDLMKAPQTGIISLANRRDVGKLQMSIRMIALERDIVAYFLSRKEDAKPTVIKPVPPKPASKKPTTSVSRSYVPTYRPTPSTIPSSYYRSTPMWTSGSYVDYHDSHWIDCTCAGHDNGAHEHDCPCCPYYTGIHEHTDEGCGEHDSGDGHREEPCSPESTNFDQGGAEEDQCYTEENQDDAAADQGFESHDTGDYHDEPTYSAEAGSFY